MTYIEKTIEELTTTNTINDINKIKLKISAIGLYANNQLLRKKTAKDKAYCQGIINTCELLLEELGVKK